MKAIVVYYSLGGKTKAAAEGFAKELGCETREIEETKKRTVLGAYVLGAFAAMRGKTSEIKPLNINYKDYDTIVLATPVWASSPVPAVNAFLEGADFKGKQAVLLICPASGDDSKASALLTEKIKAKGGVVLQHHAFKTAGANAENMRRNAGDTAKLYK